MIGVKIFLQLLIRSKPRVFVEAIKPIYEQVTIFGKKKILMD